jgi:hypothetical protein
MIKDLASPGESSKIAMPRGSKPGERRGGIVTVAVSSEKDEKH